jgi:hypothetical protein
MINKFDLVFLVGKNDESKIKEYLNANKQNIIGYKNIYIISPCDIYIPGTILIKDDIFPFKIADINKYEFIKPRGNWYLQQLIKLYALFVIPGISDRILIVDADTFFIKPTEFIDNDDKILLNYGFEYNEPYFKHMTKLHNSLHRFDSNRSGVVHHMLFDKKILKELFDLVEDYHKKAFWVAFLDCVGLSKDEAFSGASEYEIYFNYCCIFHNDKIKVRRLYFNDWFCKEKISINDMSYVSNHDWMKTMK